MGKVGDDPFGRIVFDLIRQDDPALIEKRALRQQGVRLDDLDNRLVVSPPGR